ncbi:MAG: Glycine cleavage system H protein [Clostridiales bacterium 38_11]|nr:MAG: Glycine cleavage system H protein [Clostridiales bacterium 38_11]HBH13848.1 glycine cleavage system protein GcvH [Clostridiales bacterium]
MKILEGLYYAKSHEWLRIEDGEAYIGISDFAQHELGDIVFVDLPSVGDEFDAQDSFGAVESVKAANDVYMPVSGVILEVNEILEESPELINEDAYENWIIKIRIKDKSDIEVLMTALQYEEHIQEEE